MTLEVVVDYSKVHNARLDQQFADGKVVADVGPSASCGTSRFPRFCSLWSGAGQILKPKASAPAPQAAVSFL